MASVSDPSEMRVRYQTVEIPQQKIVEEIKYIQEVRKVPIVKHNIVSQDRLVPRQVVKRVTEDVPQVHYKAKEVEIPRIQYVDVPVRQEYKIPRVEVKVIHEEVSVPGSIYHVPKPVVKEIHETVRKFVDSESAVTAGVMVQPYVEESTEYKQVEKTKKYIPQVVPIEIYLPVPVHRKLRMAESFEELRGKTLPAAQFNAQLKAMNPNTPEEHLMNLYQRLPDGSIPTTNKVLPAETNVPPPNPQPLANVHTLMDLPVQ